MSVLLSLKSSMAVSLVFALLGLTAIETSIEPVVKDMKEQVVAYAEKELRVPPFDSVVYTPLWIEHLREKPDDRHTIALFGTSTVYGTTVMKGKNTSAGVLQSHLPDHRVLNLGLTGARFTETYAILSSVINEVDVALFEINYGMTVVMDNEAKPVVYPALIGKLGGGISRDLLSGFPEKDADALPSDEHRWISEQVLHRWTLYHDRDALSYHYLKTRTPKEKIRRQFQKWQQEQTGEKAPVDPLYVPYDKMSEESKRRIDDGFRELYVWGRPFDEEHSFGLFMIGKTVDLLQARHKKAVFYTAPLDYDLIANRKLIDWEQYRKVMGAYRKLVESRGFTFVEFNTGKNVVPHKLYRDPTHLTDEGNKKFGEILYDRIRELL